MPCFAPRLAWKKPGVSKLFLGLTPPTKDSTALNVACQKCIGCQQTNARNWAFRCEMELANHDAAVFTTLTVENTDLHPTLNVDEIQRFYKRLRERNSRLATNRPIRHFTAGEYGTTNKRPHYHAIIFGADTTTHGRIIQEAWGLGFTTTYKVTPETIAYVAGYTAKKARWVNNTITHERINPNTGEVYEHQPEFFLMSRGGRTGKGIGSNMLQHTHSWRDHAIYDGLKMPVPRYYHQAWKDSNTPIDWHLLKTEKELAREQREKSGNYKQQRIDAAEQIMKIRQQHTSQRREL